MKNRYVKHAQTIKLNELLSSDQYSIFEQWANQQEDSTKLTSQNLYHNIINYLFTTFKVVNLDSNGVAETISKIPVIGQQQYFLRRIRTDASLHTRECVMKLMVSDSAGLLKDLIKMVLEYPEDFPSYDDLSPRLVTLMAKKENMAACNSIIQKLSSNTAKNDSWEPLVRNLASKAGQKQNYHSWVIQTGHQSAIRCLDNIPVKPSKNATQDSDLDKAFGIRYKEPTNVKALNVANESMQTKSIDGILGQLFK